MSQKTRRVPTSAAITLLNSQLSRTMEEIPEVPQRDLDPVGSVSQLVPQLVQRPLEQPDFQKQAQVLSLGRQQSTVHRREVCLEEDGADPVPPKARPAPCAVHRIRRPSLAVFIRKCDTR